MNVNQHDSAELTSRPRFFIECNVNNAAASGSLIRVIGSIPA
jgi:hypothetical protein